MKSKFKFDQKAILDALLQHVEKMVLGIFVVIFLWMIYSALSNAGRFDKTPQQLLDEVGKSRENIQETQPKPNDLRLVDYVSLAKQSRSPIDETSYAASMPWTPQMFAKPSLRETPPLLPVQQLRGSAAVGAFQLATNTADEQSDQVVSGIGGLRWVVLTALVPKDKQDNIFAESFKSSIGYDPQRDALKYLGYKVQRLEISDVADAANPDWSKAQELFSIIEIEKAKQQWQSTGSEVVSRDYIDDNLVFPLAPLVGGAWDEAVAHVPDIPLETAARGFSERNTEDTKPDALQPDGNKAPDAITWGQSEGESGVRAGSVERVTPSAEKQTPGNLLFRFFDFNAEQGKKYVYRVSLVYANPNYQVKETLLKSPDLAKNKVVYGNWSDPSPVIFVPRDTQVFLDLVKPSLRTGMDPSASVVIATWSKRAGVEVSKDFTLVRGQVANFAGEDVKAMGSSIKIDFLSGATVIDIRGGKRFHRSTPLTAPGEFLVLDPDGRLVVCNELDDKPTVQRLREAAKAAESTVSPTTSVEESNETGRGGLERIERGRTQGSTR